MELQSVRDSGMQLSGFELELVISLLNSRHAVGGSVKDLRLIDSVIGSLKSALPAKPDRPIIRQLSPEEKSYPKEELEEIQKQQQEWAKKFDEYLNLENEVHLSDNAKILIKERIQNFSSFNTDETTRARVLKLASKFGV